jgi:DNA adenine methylase
MKWPGGKRSIMSDLLPRVPGTYKAYYEPFTGGGALYFRLQPDDATISDVNCNLMTTYTQVRDDVDAVIRILAEHEPNHNPEYYYKVRSGFPVKDNPAKIAGDMIYLNRTCFNGMYRENRKGKFNVPVGKYVNPAILDESNLRAASRALASVRIVLRDFSCTEITEGGFYYLDPPYHGTYSQYSSGGFNDDKHIELADFCHRLDKAGAFFMLSNSDTTLIRKLYDDYNIEQVAALRSVSRKAEQRKRENELLIRNYGCIRR